jgi:DNA-binding transcriptional LysR family regulator
MTLSQMRYILEIHRCGSMNKAAQALFVSQSAVSNAIRELEEELGITIFHRSNRGITLTEDGRELVAQITPIVEGSRKILRYYSERRAENRVKLSIATQRYPFCAKAFVEFLHLREEPRLEVSLKEMEMSRVIDEVASQASDLGVLFVTDLTERFISRILEARNLVFQPLVRMKPRVFMRRGHPLAKQSAVRMEELWQYPYAMFTQDELNMNYAEEVVVGTAADFDQVVYVSDRATIYNVMAHTDCVSTGSGILPDGYGDDRIVTVPLTDSPDMCLGFIRIRDMPMSEMLWQFVEILRQITDEFGEKR